MRNLESSSTTKALTPLGNKFDISSMEIAVDLQC
jgi:hypothetical protein